MPKYLVLTHNDRNVVIEADRFEVGSGTYVFFTDNKLVASVDSHVLGVVESANAFKDDFYDDVTNDLEDFVESDLFFDKVLDIVDGYHQEPDVAEYAPKPDFTLGKIEHYRKEDENWWGFFTPSGSFVPFSNKKSAEEGLGKFGVAYQFWAYKDLTGYEKVED